MTTTVAWVDAQAGIAGDMFLGALVDAGLDPAELETVVGALGLDGVSLEVRRVQKGPLAATKVEVLVDGIPADPVSEHEGQAHGHRTLGEIEDRIRAAEGLPRDARANALRTFAYLAVAEAKVHGSTPEEVHFHEVGAADALVDIVGTCVGLKKLGVGEVRVSPLPWSTGTIRTAHGDLPLPAPAVCHLLAGHPTFPSGEGREQVTPTGAALVRALARGSDVPAGFVPRVVGAGAGTQDGERLPNVVRIVLGEVERENTPTDAVVLAANLDDVTGQEVARAIARVLEEEALDAWATPVTMKKGRPGLVLTVLVRPGDERRIERVLFRETPTLGIRRHTVARTVLPRRHVPVDTPWGEVRMKVRETPDGDEATPEHDDVWMLSERHGIALRRVSDAARERFARERQTDEEDTASSA
jgi:uncharacterized protein (TIGR00299 family) protein